MTCIPFKNQTVVDLINFWNGLRNVFYFFLVIPWSIFPKNQHKCIRTIPKIYNLHNILKKISFALNSIKCVGCAVYFNRKIIYSNSENPVCKVCHPIYLSNKFKMWQYFANFRQFTSFFDSFRRSAVDSINLRIRNLENLTKKNMERIKTNLRLFTNIIFEILAHFFIRLDNKFGGPISRTNDKYYDITISY